jgi:acyl transferase domain-containing protein
MYALHLAVNSIRASDCDSAIVASANWIGDPGVQIALDKLGALSASSRCHTFDARAEGYARGEGYSAIYLKRPSLAIADESPIRAMIRGTAINSNGRTGGITRPSAKGQETVIREAYRNAGGLPFQDTSYFECHGTGTYVGDPIETAAVGSVFAEFRTDDDPLLIGSVKSNVGHGEGASALASIMKVVLALEHGTIPPIFNLETRNPNINFDGARVRPVTEVIPWPKDKLRRASINSFGYGGANAHCIIDHVENVLPEYVAPGIYKSISNGETNGHHIGEPLSHVTTRQQTGHSVNGTNGDISHHSDEQSGNSSVNGHGTAQLIKHNPLVGRLILKGGSKATTRPLVLLPFSGHNESSLRLNVEALSKIIEEFPLADVAYTLSSRRSKLAYRSYRILEKDDLIRGLLVDKPAVRSPLRITKVGFIFTRQGAQWHGMGAELFEYRIFRTAIEYLDQTLCALSNPPSWSLLSILSGDCPEDAIQTAEIAQTICTAVQVGLVDLLASRSVRPVGVAGHSSGGIAAAYASGRITAADAIVAAYLRGQAVSKNIQEGAMLAVGLGVDEVTPYMQGWEHEVTIAAINSPGSVTLSGKSSAIDQISSAMTDSGVFNRKLKTGGNAYHSHHMLPIGQDYVEMLSKGTPSQNKLNVDDPKQRYRDALWISSVTPSTSSSKIETSHHTGEQISNPRCALRRLSHGLWILRMSR